MAAAVALGQHELSYEDATTTLPTIAGVVAAEPIAAAEVQIQRILLAVDGSPRDSSAVGLARVLAQTLGASVDVLHVDTEGASDHSLDPVGLRNAVDQLAAAGVSTVGHVVRAAELDVADAIADTATEVGADLVIAAPHHRDRLGRWLEPSVTEQLTEQLNDRSSAAVLLVA
jgi:nucleotide-binding universal stress UspA family protein